MPLTIRQQAEALAKADGISMNHFISLALAEKISRLEQEAKAAQLPARPSSAYAANSFKQRSVYGH